MIEHSRVSTRGLRVGGRAALVRDTAFDLFNLEVDHGRVEPAAVSADIRIARSAVAGLMEIDTSWSVVERTRARANATPTGNLLIYLVHRGGSWFQNERGQEFTTSEGSIVVGSQDAAYRAAAAAGQHWKFHALSVPQKLFSNAADRIRQDGFQLVPAQAPVHALLSSYLRGLCRDFATFEPSSTVASLKALDELVAAALGSLPPEGNGLAATVAAERLRLALRYIEDNVRSPGLSPDAVARHLCVSPRQMHRVFETAGKTLAGEVRRIRLQRAASMLRGQAALPVTDVAFACGFDSLATFYRCFKTQFGATASEFRAGMHR